MVLEFEMWRHFAIVFDCVDFLCLIVWFTLTQSYIYQVLQTIQMKLILLCVWAEPAVLGSAKTALKFIYRI